MTDDNMLARLVAYYEVKGIAPDDPFRCRHVEACRTESQRFTTAKASFVGPGVILDGASALHTATHAVFGEVARIQRCQVHKPRNMLDHLPERQRPWVQAVVRRAYQATDSKVATRLLTDLAKRLDHEYPSAAGSVREGLEETLTIVTLQLSSRLQRSLTTTNASESLLSRTRHVKRNVECWRGWQMMLRWVAAGVLEAVKGLRRLKGHADMPRLVAALRARDQRLGLGVSVEHVA